MMMLMFLSKICLLFSYLVIAFDIALGTEDASTVQLIDTKDLKVLVEEANDWAHHIGMIMRQRNARDRSDVAEVAPYTIFPSPFPRELFQEATGVQEAMTLLYFRVAMDHEFLKEQLKEVSETDETIKRLISIMDDVREEIGEKGIHQPLALMWQRADYMTHKHIDDEDQLHHELKQIEVNNGAAGGFIGYYATELHRRMLSKAGIDTNNLPENNPLNTLGKGLYEAWLKFGNPNAIVAVVEPRGGSLTYFADHKIAQELDRISGGKIKTEFVHWQSCLERMRLADDFSLMLDDKVVAVIFYRVTFLSPIEKIPAESWSVRRFIERSTAIKSPTIGMLLASTKKIQQVLAMPNMVERFFQDPKDEDKVKAIRATFTGLWGLEHDDDKTKAVIADAKAHPENYVLKPNREAGGYNIWGNDIVEKLNTFTPVERAQHILMQKMNPIVTKNFFVRPLKEPEYGEVVTEFSPFGVLLGNVQDGTVLYQNAHGNFMRTKWAWANEGGIMKGTGVYDSPLLV